MACGCARMQGQHCCVSLCLAGLLMQCGRPCRSVPQMMGAGLSCQHAVMGLQGLQAAAKGRLSSAGDDAACFEYTV